MNEIEVIWKFLDNLDEYVYATDIETDELVYMNRKLLEVYGLQSIDDVKGMKCYEVLQKSSVPCGMCNNDRLCAGKFVEWRYYNPVIDKYMMLKDTLVEDPVTNKKYRIEISIDISEERSQDKMIQKYRDMESFVNEALKDALTQLGNRFAMEKYVRQIDPEQSVGVVYCDVTGLKGVNDTLGHKAGDDLILRAGACLEQVFGDYGVFRIGGDELLVLCAQIDQDTLAERIRQLECLTAEKDVNIAVGVIWQDRADTHLDELLQEAEKRMYEDKAEYYKKTGIERRGADKKG